MKTLKRVNMVMWALETKLVQPKGNGSPWLLGHAPVYESFTRGRGWYVLSCKGFYAF